jgi:Ricin-type beta-trefoil lectin domain
VILPFRRALLLVAAVALSASAARAEAHGTNFKVKLATADFCMDAEGDHQKDGDKVFLYKCHGKENQRWTLTTETGGGLAVVGTGGFCLDVRGTHSKADGTPVQLWACHFGPNQRFKYENEHLKEVASGKCLLATDVKNAASIVLDECVNEPNQRWVLQR